MAVTADILYKGVSLVGITFAVEKAIHHENAIEGTLTYFCDVIMPDGSKQSDTGWERIVSKEPDFTLSPLADAELQMVARLTAIGATNMVTT